MMKNVRILLATYNGEQYIAEMIESILEQDYTEWSLILSDDQSKDRTAEILESYARNYPDRITHYRSGIRFGNAQDHFMHLLQKFSDAPYIMFCDQDDIWHTDKISKTLDRMRQIEKTDIPTLVHTDLRVVDAQLQEIDASFMHYSNLRGDRLQLRQLLVQNVVTGCTMMINQQLAELVCSHMPDTTVRMHDWWLALLAASVGTIGYLNEATIDYRQHGNNAVGASNAGSLRFVISKLKDNRIAKSMRISFEQAQIFGECFDSVVSEEAKKLISAYSSLAQRGWFSRKIIYFQYGFWKYGCVKQFGQFLFG